MGVALYIVVKKKIRGFDPFVNGKAIGHADEKAITDLCTMLGVPSLFSFISQDLGELEEFLLDEGLDMEEPDELPKEEWFSAEEGLVSVRALIAHLANNASALANAEAVIEDLREYEQVLVTLAEKKTLWHFAVDY